MMQLQAKEYATGTEIIEGARSLRYLHAPAPKRKVSGIIETTPPVPRIRKSYPLWQWFTINFDHHIKTWRNELASHTRSYLRRRCRDLEVSYDDVVLGDRGTNDTAMTRQILMWECWKKLGKSYSEIGRTFRRDHATVMWACRKVERLKAEGKL